MNNDNLNVLGLNEMIQQKTESNLNINRGSYMSAHVLLNLLNELGKRDKMRGLSSILFLFRNELINSIIQEHERQILLII